jgi:hypothetical protein
MIVSECILAIVFIQLAGLCIYYIRVSRQRCPTGFVGFIRKYSAIGMFRVHYYAVTRRSSEGKEP